MVSVARSGRLERAGDAQRSDVRHPARIVRIERTAERLQLAGVFPKRPLKEADALANEAMDQVEGGAPKSAKSAAPAPKPEARGPVGEVRKIRARFRSGVLYLLEDVDLPDGVEVDVLLRLLPPKS